VQSATAIATVI